MGGKPSLNFGVIQNNMKIEKISLSGVKKVLSRAELKVIMAGSGVLQCVADSSCHIGCRDFRGNCSACCLG